MGAIASQITSLAIVYSIVYSDADQRKHQSSASLAFVCGTHRGPVNSPHKWPVTRKMFPFDDVIMSTIGRNQPNAKHNKMRPVYIIRGMYLYFTHNSGVIMNAMASQITSDSSVYSTVYSGADQENIKATPLAFVRGIHRGRDKGLVTRIMFPFDDVIIQTDYYMILLQRRVQGLWGVYTHLQGVGVNDYRYVCGVFISSCFIETRENNSDTNRLIFFYSQ